MNTGVSSMALVGGLLAGLGGLCFTPRVASSPSLQWAFGGAALVLAIWLGVLLITRRVGGFDVIVRRNHYIQPMCQLSVLLYWGWYWRPVYEAAWLFVGQLLFVYAFDLLLAWTLKRRAWLSFGPFPIVISTNLFLWFRDDWFFLQFAMLATGVLGKALIRWERDGQRTHVFNPSAFCLSVFSIGLIAANATHVSWGNEIAYTQAYPPLIYVLIFGVGLVVQGFFSVTMMTLSAVATTWALSGLWFAATGVHYFVDSDIPIAVFLGMHLLFTDPSTSPRSSLGRAVFGAAYGASVFALYWLFEQWGIPTFYDKLLPVPILNLSVQLIDRWTRRVAARGTWARWSAGASARLSPRGLNAVHMGVWVTLFGAMWATNAVGHAHPGGTAEFWETACAEGRFQACARLLAVREGLCGEGRAVHCDALGRLYAEGRWVKADAVGAARAFSMACENGHAPACGETAVIVREGRGVARNPPLAAALFGLGCRGGDVAACEGGAAMLQEGDGVPVDREGAAAMLSLACTAGRTAACDRLGTLRR